MNEQRRESDLSVAKRVAESTVMILLSRIASVFMPLLMVWVMATLNSMQLNQAGQTETLKNHDSRITNLERKLFGIP